MIIGQPALTAPIPLGPCVIDLSTFELDPDVGHRHYCDIEGSLVQRC